MVEQVDRDDKKEDKAANEVVDNVLTSTLATTACTGLQLAKECLNLKNSKAQNVKQWIYDFDMFSIEGDENCWIENCLQDD